MKLRTLHIGEFYICRELQEGVEVVRFFSYNTQIGVLYIDGQVKNCTVSLNPYYSYTTQRHRGLMLGYLIARFNPHTNGLDEITRIKAHAPRKKHWQKVINEDLNEIKIIEM